MTGIPCNVADAAAVTAAFEAIKATGNRVDVMINNAGIAAVGNVEKATEAEMDRVFAVNVKGVFHCCQESCKMMVRPARLCPLPPVRAAEPLRARRRRRTARAA